MRYLLFNNEGYLSGEVICDAEALELRNKIIDELILFLDEDNEISMDLFLNYETYFNDILVKQVDPIETMAVAVFDKYNINDCQSELLKRKNEPNPVLFNELRKYLSHFIWNWDEFLEKCKITF